MGIASHSRNFVVGRKAGLASFQIAPNPTHRFCLVRKQSILPLIVGDVREEHVRRSVLVFFRQIPERFDGLFKKSGHTRILYHSEVYN